MLTLGDNALTNIGPALEPCAASLAVLALPNNSLRSIASSSLTHCTLLRHLDLSANRLTTLDGIQHLPLLQSLSARCNALPGLPAPLALPYLTALDLSQNTLTGLFSTTPTSTTTTPGSHQQSLSILLPSLEKLNLQDNRIERIGPVGHMPRLTSLDLSFNSLASLVALQALAVAAPGLLELQLSDNPATAWLAALDGPAGRAGLGLGGGAAALAGMQGPGRGGRAGAEADGEPVVAYRRMVQSLLPGLRELDHVGVEEAARAEAVVRAHTAAPLAAAAVMRGLRTGAVVALCVPTRCHSQQHQQQASCSSSSCSSSRSLQGGRPQRLRCAGVALRNASVVRCQPSALRAVLSGAACAGGMGLAAAAPGARHYSPCFALSPAAAPLDDAAGPAGTRVANASYGGRTSRAASGTGEGLGVGGGHVPAADWLTRAEQMWAAGTPAEVAAEQRRQQAAGQMIAAAAAAGGGGGGAKVVGAPSADELFAPAAVSAVGHLATSGVLLDGGAPLRALQPLAKALTGLRLGGTAAGATSSNHQRSLQQQQPVVPAEVEAACDAAEAAVRQHHVPELRRLVYTVCGGGGHGALQAPEPLLRVQASYFARRLACDGGGAAAVIQAHWRGLKARRLAALLRSKHHQVQCREAAVTIQAWWRGHQVRVGSDLAARRSAAAAAREAKRREEARRREAAATRIQVWRPQLGTHCKESDAVTYVACVQCQVSMWMCHGVDLVPSVVTRVRPFRMGASDRCLQAWFRGHVVRKRLRAARAAARLPASDLDDLPGFDHDPDDPAGLGGLEDMMAFLQPLERMFAEEEAAALPPAKPAAGAGGVLLPPQHPMAWATPAAVGPSAGVLPLPPPALTASLPPPHTGAAAPVGPWVAAGAPASLLNRAVAPPNDWTQGAAGLPAYAGGLGPPSGQSGSPGSGFLPLLQRGSPPPPSSQPSHTSLPPIAGAGANSGGGGRPSPLTITEYADGVVDPYGNGNSLHDNGRRSSTAGAGEYGSEYGGGASYVASTPGSVVSVSPGQEER